MTADPAPRSVGESGEDAVLAVILEELGELHRASTDLAALTLAPGDDAAVLELPEDGAPARIVLTTDTLSQDQDFRPGWWAPQQQGAPMGRAVGLKAAAQNLSDLNAMAATPIALLVSLTLPTTTSLDWVRGFYRGLAKAVRREGAEHCHIAGGDLGSGPGISVTLTALGRLPAGRPPLRRTGARPGDQLAVSGPLGAAA
ncbi:thiamine-phosphate kinase, partial [Nesterenkonia sp. E16_10]